MYQGGTAARLAVLRQFIFNLNGDAAHNAGQIEVTPITAKVRGQDDDAPHIA